MKIPSPSSLLPFAWAERSESTLTPPSEAISAKHDTDAIRKKAQTTPYILARRKLYGKTGEMKIPTHRELAPPGEAFRHGGKSQLSLAPLETAGLHPQTPPDWTQDLTFDGEVSIEHQKFSAYVRGYLKTKELLAAGTTIEPSKALRMARPYLFEYAASLSNIKQWKVVLNVIDLSLASRIDFPADKRKVLNNLAEEYKNLFPEVKLAAKEIISKYDKDKTIYADADHQLLRKKIRKLIQDPTTLDLITKHSINRFLSLRKKISYQP